MSRLTGAKTKDGILIMIIDHLSPHYTISSRIFLPFFSDVDQSKYRLRPLFFYLFILHDRQINDDYITFHHQTGTVHSLLLYERWV